MMTTCLRKTAIRRLAVLTAIALLALTAPDLALAHSGSATVSCTGAEFSFSSFQPGSNTVHYVVTVDQVPAAQGDFTLNAAGGEAGSLHVPLSIGGTHTVEANAWWGPEGIVGGHTRPANSPPLASEVVTCPSPPPATAPAPPAPAPPPATSLPNQQRPEVGVEGRRESKPARIARLSTASMCTSRRVRVTVTGRSMRQVALSVNGRRVRTVNVHAGQRSVRVSLRMPKQVITPIVTARVLFRNGAPSRTLRKTARRCSPVVVQPHFTG
jgi:hypothetical protein